MNEVLLLLGNYLVVQIAIILFILPFYWLYSRKHIKGIEQGEVKVSFNRHLENFFSSRYANWLIFFWAMGEALVWFVIPEFLLLLMIFMRIRRKRQLLLYDLYGTTAGTLVAFSIHLPERLVENLPYVQPAMVEQVRHWFEDLGILGLVYQPFSGVPYKVFTHIAQEYGFFLPAFLAVAVVVRVSRYLIFYAMLSSIYPVLHKFVYRNYIRLFLIATFIFSILLLKVYKAYGADYHVGFIFEQIGKLSA